MLYDMLTITQKELKEIFVQRGSLKSGIGNLLIIVALIGILFPLQMGQEWIRSPFGLIMVAWMPMMMSMGLVADAFAGERERHTLETLLATRLSDASILLGKVLASVVYGLGIVVAGILLGAVTANLQHPGIGFYPVEFLAGALAFSLLGLLLISGIGVLVSLHASNVRQAYQRMSIGFLFLWLPLVFGPQILPESWKLRIGQWLMQIDLVQVLIFMGAGLLVLDIVLIVTALARFQRAKLILD